jgi:F0F1-type ATP synthase membrane subunit b/b'
VTLDSVTVANAALAGAGGLLVFFAKKYVSDILDELKKISGSVASLERANASLDKASALATQRQDELDEQVRMIADRLTSHLESHADH